MSRLFNGSRVVSIGLLALGSFPSQAEERAPAFEITPFAGLRLGGDFELAAPAGEVDLDDAGSLALALGLRFDEVSQYELFYGRQSTSLERGSALGDVDVDIEYLHVGGTLDLSEQPRFTPYIMGSLGATRFSPDPAEAQDETAFSIAIGGGLRVPFNERFSLRLEGRGYLTLVDTDTALFCRSDEDGGVCRLRGSGSTFIQYELLAGAAFAF